MNLRSKLTKARGYALARIFSSAVICELAEKGRSAIAASILKETDILKKFDVDTLLCDFFDQVYGLLFRSYRNEYVYKNAIARKILLGVHSLNTASMLTEFRSGPCKADVVVLNGTSTVYEIKSAYDSTERLARQVEAYRQVFEYINIITSRCQLGKVNREVGNDIGLMVLTNRNTISTEREPSSLKKSVSPYVIFDSLRKSEYTQIVRGKFGKLPQVSNARMYRACRELFCSLDPIEVHDAMVAVLKKRGSNKRLKDFILSMPESLIAASLSCKISVAGKVRFTELLKEPISRCFVG